MPVRRLEIHSSVGLVNHLFCSGLWLVYPSMLCIRGRFHLWLGHRTGTHIHTTQTYSHRQENLSSQLAAGGNPCSQWENITLLMGTLGWPSGFLNEGFLASGSANQRVSGGPMCLLLLNNTYTVKCIKWGFKRFNKRLSEKIGILKCQSKNETNNADLFLRARIDSFCSLNYYFHCFLLRKKRNGNRFLGIPDWSVSLLHD